MSRIRKLIEKSRSTMGLQLALALLVPAKAKAAQDAKPKPTKQSDGSDSRPESQTAPPHLTGRWDFSRLFDVAAQPEKVSDIEVSNKTVQKVARDAVKLAASAGLPGAKVTATAEAVADNFTPKPMTHEEIRLWLQSFNAGPYATLKYKGEVPYKETRDYVPRVMKAYEQDFDTEYDQHIQKYAKKYGLDPQLVKAIMKTESDFKNETVSHAGARGLMQVMPIVWKDVQKKYGFDWEYSTGVFEPEKNIEVACAYLAWLRYDFLPRHFDAYDRNPDAPAVLVRDFDRGVPDRQTPRIVVGAASPADVVAKSVEVASVVEKKESNVATDAGSGGKSSKAEVSEAKSEQKKSVSQSDSAKETAKADDSKSAREDKTETKAAAKPKVEITDADSVVKKSVSNGKTRVVVRGGGGKSVKIAVNNGKVVTPAKETAKPSDKEELTKKKRPAVAEARKVTKESQGG